MAENFNLIFGSQAPETASWSDADYQTGWNTVGSTPPTAEQFDALQNRSDKKSQELNNRLSPLERKAREQGRQAGTAYTVGAAVTVDRLPADWLLVCTKAGKSGTAAINLPNPLIDGATITDGTITWKLRKVATNGGLGYRQPSTAYTAGNIAYHSALPTGYYLECTTAGITSAGEITPSSMIGGTVTDGTVVWKVHIIFGAKYYDMPSDINDILSSRVSLATPTTGNVPTNDEYFVVTTLGNDERSYGSVHQIAVGTDTGKVHSRFKAGAEAWKAWRQQEAIVAKSPGENGYIKYASGLIIQWGVAYSQNGASIGSGIYAQSITLPLAFTNLKTNAIIANLEDHSSIRPCQCYPTTPSAFSLMTTTNLNFQIRWMAIGS